MSESELTRCQHPDVTHHAGCACHEEDWQARLLASVMETDRLRMLAGELVAFIRVNVMRDTFTGATIEQVDECLAPFVARLKQKAAPVSRDG